MESGAAVSYTVQELNEAVEEGFIYTYLNHKNEPREIAAEGWRELNEALFYFGRNARVVIDGIGTLGGVEDHGGGEGDGEERWYVFSVTDAAGERLFRRNGYYASYDGSHFDGPTEAVAPVQKTVTVYEAVA